jgi:hypothetical protein
MKPFGSYLQWPIRLYLILCGETWGCKQVAFPEVCQLSEKRQHRRETAVSNLDFGRSPKYYRWKDSRALERKMVNLYFGVHYLGISIWAATCQASFVHEFVSSDILRPRTWRSFLSKEEVISGDMDPKSGSCYSSSFNVDQSFYR